MTINILKAISKMLDQEGLTETQAYMVKAACAKIMLDEVIKGLEQDGSLTITHDPGPGVVTKPKPEPLPKGKYKVVVDASGKMTGIEGLDPNALILMDGKKIRHKDAIGKTFEKVTLL